MDKPKRREYFIPEPLNVSVEDSAHSQFVEPAVMNHVTRPDGDSRSWRLRCEDDGLKLSARCFAQVRGSFRNPLCRRY